MLSNVWLLWYVWRREYGDLMYDCGVRVVVYIFCAMLIYDCVSLTEHYSSNAIPSADIASLGYCEK